MDSTLIKRKWLLLWLFYDWMFKNLIEIHFSKMSQIELSLGQEQLNENEIISQNQKTKMKTGIEQEMQYS